MAQSSIVGCILGTAVGDSIGLPYEGLSRHRAVKLLGVPDRHRFFFGRGMFSDDTEQTCMVAQSLIASNCEIEEFRRSLGWRLRFWLLGLPAGIGRATLRGLIRLWLGFPPQQSGVLSAGNGPTMRAAILGAALNERQQLRDFVRASSRITHTDPKAEYGAYAVALAAQMARDHEKLSPAHFVDELRRTLDGDGDELVTMIADAASSANEGQGTQAFADGLGLDNGVSGYVYHSVPVAIHAWFTHPRDFRLAITSVIQCGGDTDSTAAIVGGIIGSSIGKDGIPADWTSNLLEWPRTVSWMERLAIQLDATVNSDATDHPIKLPVWGLIPRNLFFLLIVLYHGFRRLLPPY